MDTRLPRASRPGGMRLRDEYHHRRWCRRNARIGVRDLLRRANVPETTASLLDLASVLIEAAYEIVDADLRRQYGVPMHKNRQGRWVETGFVVLGMGKLGGHELNYSSDVCEPKDRSDNWLGHLTSTTSITPLGDKCGNGWRCSRLGLSPARLRWGNGLSKS